MPRTITVSAEDLKPGDRVGEATIGRAWIATNPKYVMYEFAEGGIRTAYRYQKFNVIR